MHFTRPRDLLLAGVLGIAIGYILFQLAYGALPPLPVLAGSSLALLAIIEVVLAFGIRKRISEARVALSGVGISRAVVLAKASSVLGSLMLGAWLGIAGYLAPRVNRLSAAQHDLPSALVGTGCACALVAAALWLEHCCRDPHADERAAERRGNQIDQ